MIFHLKTKYQVDELLDISIWSKMFYFMNPENYIWVWIVKEVVLFWKHLKKYPHISMDWDVFKLKC